ncbi:RNA polymerase II-associated protein 3-like protein [Drosera capensis]
MDFQGFLDDLSDWELSLKDKDRKLGARGSDRGKSNGKSSSAHDSGKAAGNHQHPTGYNALNQLSTSFIGEESSVDAVSEKEQGNEFREAEHDCTEALNLDDRNIKAYSRRATARKELGKLRESLEDAEFALRLEPQNVDVKKQFNEIKSLLGKAILQKSSETSGSSGQGVKQVQSKAKPEEQTKATLQKSSKTGGNSIQGVKQLESKADSKEPAKDIHLVPSSGNKTKIQVLPDKVSLGKAVGSMDVGNVDQEKTGSQTLQHTGASSSAASSKQLVASVEQLASRAASRAMQEAAKNISPPNSAYKFEVSWKGFHGDLSLQARLLKVTPPNSLPRILKNALSAPILMEMVKCITTFFMEDTELAVKHLENLTKVSRFGVLILCLSSADKADLRRIWDEVFLGKATPIEYAETLDALRPKYCP